MLKRLTVLAAMRDMNTFLVADLAASSGVGENTVQTVLQRMDAAWLTKESMPTGAKGRAPVRYSLTDVGREGVASELGRVAYATSARGEAAEPAVGVQVPLGLESAEDTVKLLTTEKSPKRAAALRRDAARDLKWAVAELQGEAYRATASELRSRVEAVRVALGEQPGSQELSVADSSDLAYEMPPPPLTTSSSQVEVIRDWRSAYEEEESILDSWRRRAYAFFRGKPSWLKEDLWSDESPGFAFNHGKHVVLACLANDDMTRELAFGAKWALNGALNVSQALGAHKDLKVHTVGPKNLQVLIGSAKSHREALSNTTFVFLLNSEELQEQVEHVLADTNALEVLRNSQMLDCSFDSRLQETTMRYHCRYVPNAVDSGHMDWIRDTMAEVSRGVASLTFEPGIEDRFRAGRMAGSSD